MNNKRQEGLERLKALKEAVRLRQEEASPGLPKMTGKRGRPKGSKNPNAGRKSKTDLDRLLRQVKTPEALPYTLKARIDVNRCGECNSIWLEPYLVAVMKSGIVYDRIWEEGIEEHHSKNCSQYKAAE